MSTPLFGAAASQRAARQAPCSKNPDGGRANTYTGLYKNYSYGFAVTIPHGRTGTAPSDPAYQRGFLIRLSGDSLISVFADVNSLEFSDAGAAARNDLDIFTAAHRSVKRVDARSTRIGSVLARANTFSYVAGDGASCMEYDIVFLRPDKSMLYDILWTGAPQNVTEAKAIIGQLTRSWKFVPVRQVRSRPAGRLFLLPVALLLRSSDSNRHLHRRSGRICRR